MRSHVGLRPWAAALGLLLVLAVGSSAALAATYYVDSAGGRDTNAGTSQTAAWQTFAPVNATTFQPGDRILLKAGSVWNNTELWPKGSGVSGNPIVIDLYGTGAKPLINGNAFDLQAVYLYNQQYWEINNLEVTNWNAAGKAEIRGIAVMGVDAGTLNHIYIRNCVIHDVNGARLVGQDKGKCNAGILLSVPSTTTNVMTHFNDVRFEDNTIYNVDMTAIKTWSQPWNAWKCNPRDYHTNVVARNNTVDNIGGDGLTLHMCIAPVTEYNVVSRCAQRTEGAAYAAVWPYETDDPVVQFNEVYQTAGTKDGEAFDIDGMTRRGILQYNYSHDNDGGFVLLCEQPGNSCFFNESPVVRYNISQNDGIMGARTFHLSGQVFNAQIYNNTIYRGPSVAANVMENFTWKGACAQNTQWRNNIFYNLGGGDYVTPLDGGATWDYNLFYGNHPAGEPPDAHKLTSDPRLVSPGSGGLGRDTCDGYQLLAGSPAIDSGITIASNGGRDYWGNPVPANGATDRGAHERPVGTLPPIADFSGNPTSGTAPLSVAFTDLSANAPTSWSWTFGDGGTSTAQNPSHSYAAGTFTVALTATNAAGSDTKTKSNYLTVSALQPPVANFMGAPTSGNAPLTVNFTDQSTNTPTSWSWTFGDGGTSAAQNPSHTYTSAGSFTVALTATNAYGSNTNTKSGYISVTSGGGGGDFSCASVVLEVGSVASGDHTSTHLSDNVRLVCNTAKVSGKYNGNLTYTFETGLGSLAALTVTDEVMYSMLPTFGYHYRYVDVWNYSTGAWVQVSRIRASTAGTDVTTVTTVPTPASYRSAGGQVKVRMRYGDMSPDPWTLSVDLMKITAAP